MTTTVTIKHISGTGLYTRTCAGNTLRKTLETAVAAIVRATGAA